MNNNHGTRYEGEKRGAAFQGHQLRFLPYRFNNFQKNSGGSNNVNGIPSNPLARVLAYPTGARPTLSIRVTNPKDIGWLQNITKQPTIDLVRKCLPELRVSVIRLAPSRNGGGGGGGGSGGNISPSRREAPYAPARSAVPIPFLQSYKGAPTAPAASSSSSSSSAAAVASSSLRATSGQCGAYMGCSKQGNLCCPYGNQRQYKEMFENATRKLVAEKDAIKSELATTKRKLSWETGRYNRAVAEKKAESEKLQLELARSSTLWKNTEALKEQLKNMELQIVKSDNDIKMLVRVHNNELNNIMALQSIEKRLRSEIRVCVWKSNCKSEQIDRLRQQLEQSERSCQQKSRDFKKLDDELLEKQNALNLQIVEREMMNTKLSRSVAEWKDKHAALLAAAAKDKEAAATLRRLNAKLNKRNAAKKRTIGIKKRKIVKIRKKRHSLRVRLYRKRSILKRRKSEVEKLKAEVARLEEKTEGLYANLGQKEELLQRVNTVFSQYKKLYAKHPSLDQITKEVRVSVHMQTAVTVAVPALKFSPPCQSCPTMEYSTPSRMRRSVELRKHVCICNLNRQFKGGVGHFETEDRVRFMQQRQPCKRCVIESGGIPPASIPGRARATQTVEEMEVYMPARPKSAASLKERRSPSPEKRVSCMRMHKLFETGKKNKSGGTGTGGGAAAAVAAAAAAVTAAGAAAGAAAAAGAGRRGQKPEETTSPRRSTRKRFPNLIYNLHNLKF